MEITQSSNRRLMALPWYGGKYSHLQWLLPLINVPALHFVDVFGGSGAVILNIEPYKIETYNDINGDVVHFFRMLRERGDELIRQLELTPYSRQEQKENGPLDCELPELERARRFAVRILQSFASGANKAGWSYSVEAARREMSLNVSSWLANIAGLHDAVCRLKTIQIENLPWQEIFKRYGRPEMMLYCDPPYLPETRTTLNTYAHEMTTEQHVEFLGAAMQCEAHIAISGYRSDLYETHLAGWHRFDSPPVVARGKVKAGGSLNYRQECVWVNYPPELAGTNRRQLPLSV